MGHLCPNFLGPSRPSWAPTSSDTHLPYLPNTKKFTEICRNNKRQRSGSSWGAALVSCVGIVWVSPLFAKGCVARAKATNSSMQAKLLLCTLAWHNASAKQVSLQTTALAGVLHMFCFIAQCAPLSDVFGPSGPNTSDRCASHNLDNRKITKPPNTMLADDPDVRHSSIYRCL